MKIIISQNALSKALEKVKSVISARAIVPILEYVKLEAKDGKLKITGCDLETFLTVTADCEIKEEGSICLVANLFTDTVKLLSGSIKISVKETSGILQSEQGAYKIPATSTEDFPISAKDDATVELLLAPDVLLDALESTLPFVSHDELRPAMCGVNFDVTKSGITFVGTDGNALCAHERFISGLNEGSYILPFKPANLLRSTMPFSDDANISISDKNIVFSWEDYTLTTRLIDERYPQYKAVFPVGDTTVLKINREAFLSALKRVRLYANKTNSQVRFKLADGFLTLSGQDVDFSSEAKEKLVCEYPHEEFEIGFNAKFLQTALGTLLTENVELHLTEYNRPAIMQAENDDSTKILIMPIVLNF